MHCWYWLADLCRDHAIPFALGHAWAMKAVHGSKTKCHRHDAEAVARLLRGGNFPLAYAYPKERRGLRDLLRARLRLVRQRAEPYGHVHAAREHYPVELAVLQSTPGVGAVPSLTILLEIDTVERFDTRLQFCSYARLCGAVRESAGKRVGVGNRRAGNAWLKWAFGEAAVFSAQKDERMLPAKAETASLTRSTAVRRRSKAFSSKAIDWMLRRMRSLICESGVCDTTASRAGPPPRGRPVRTHGGGRARFSANAMPGASLDAGRGRCDILYAVRLDTRPCSRIRQNAGVAPRPCPAFARMRAHSKTL